MNSQIYEEAAEWLVEFRTEQPDPPARTRFEKWLSTSPERVRAYLDVTTVWETISAQPPATLQDIDALIERARTITNIVPLASAQAAAISEAADGSPESLEPARRSALNELKSRSSIFSRRRAFFASAATLLVAVIGIGTYLHAQRGVYATAIGEQRSVLLSDGSTIDLNARSRVRVRMRGHERSIDLIEGQALFHVAKDEARPFIVDSNGTRVRAVGTRFDVNRRKHGTTVTVLEGSVSVAKPQAREGGARVLLIAGEQVTITTASTAKPEMQSALPKPRRADIVTATAWTQRRLIFDATPLEDVVTEFNLNNERPIVISGDGLADFHVSGAFSSTDVQPFLRFLRTQDGIQIIEERDRIIITH